MSHRELFDYLKSKDKTIDVEGNIITLPSKIAEYCFNIYIFVMIIYFIEYILEQADQCYYPITLYSTNLYSKFAEQILILNKIKYQKIYHPVLINPGYYLQSKRKTVTINPDLSDFHINTEIPFIPLSIEELQNLSQHTKIDYDLLVESQEFILEHLPGINSYHVVRENYLYDEDFVYTKNNIKSIEKINNLYRVTCTDYTFYTSFILTDSTLLLQPGEVVSVAYTNDKQEEVQYVNKYIVNEEYKLESLGKKLKPHITLLPFYTLDTPRPNLILNPLHLPKTKDFILCIMIIVQAMLL